MYAFAEAGKTPQVPGPLIRVPEGTEVRLVLRNRVTKRLLLRACGLEQRSLWTLCS